MLLFRKERPGWRLTNPVWADPNSHAGYLAWRIQLHTGGNRGKSPSRHPAHNCARWALPQRSLSTPSADADNRHCSWADQSLVHWPCTRANQFLFLNYSRIHWQAAKQNAQAADCYSPPGYGSCRRNPAFARPAHKPHHLYRPSARRSV